MGYGHNTPRPRSGKEEFRSPRTQRGGAFDEVVYSSPGLLMASGLIRAIEFVMT
jgi:hypothetical protein